MSSVLNPLVYVTIGGVLLGWLGWPLAAACGAALIDREQRDIKTHIDKFKEPK